MAAESPLQRLAAYHEQALRHVVDLSAEVERRQYWRAVSFRVAQALLLVDERDVFELLSLPRVTAVPGTKRWVAGIANVRGELLPVIDFGDFLFGRAARRGKQARVLVIQYTDLRSGLIVDQVYGVRHLPLDERKDDVTMSGIDPSGAGDAMSAQPLKAVLGGSFEDDLAGERQIFHIMEVEKLVKETGFMQAAD